MRFGVRSLLRALLARRAFTCLTRTAIATTPAAAVATLAFLAFLHRRAWLARRLVCTGLPRFAGRTGLLLVPALLVHIAARALSVATTAVATLRARLTRGTIAT